MKHRIKIIMILLAVIYATSCSSAGKKEMSSVNETDMINENTTVETEPETEPRVVYKMGDTVSTDIWTFKFNKAFMATYASASLGDNYGKRAKSGKEYEKTYVASRGEVLIPFFCTIENKDRVSSTLGDDKGWGGTFYIRYDGQEYPIYAYGYVGHYFLFSDHYRLFYENETICLISGNYMVFNGARDVLVQSEEALPIILIGVAEFEPKNMDDSFEIIAKIPNSKGERETFEFAF